MAKRKSKSIEGEVIVIPKHKKKPTKKNTSALMLDSKKNPTQRAVLRSENSAVIVGLSTEQLKNALEVQTEQRGLIKDFVQKHLVKGTDYGQIHVVKNCQAEIQKRGSCEQQSHFSKAILYKPGQEKIFSLFSLTNDLVRDEETIQMLEGTKGLVAYKCIVYRNDQKIAEGRGAAVVGDNRRDANATIKIAEKRARMDACLALGFSEYFAQDLDDPDYQSQRQMAQEEAAARAEAEGPYGLPPRDSNLPADTQERTVLARLFVKLGITDQKEQLETLKVNGIADPKKMTSGQIRTVIKKFGRNTFTRPIGNGITHEPVDDELPPDEPAVDIDDVEDANPLPPDIKVDADFKKEVKKQYGYIGFNTRGQQWFMRTVRGTPFKALWDDFTPADWQKSYETIQDILDGRMALPEHYFGKPVGKKQSDPIVNIKKVFNDAEEVKDGQTAIA